MKYIDIKIFTTTFILIAISIAFMYGSSAKVAQRLNLADTYFLTRQLIYGLISVILILFIARINPKVFLKLSSLTVLITLTLLIMVLIPGIGSEISGTRRWIDIGLFYIQPSELSKLAIILFMAKKLSSPELKLNSFKDLAPMLLIIGLFFTLIFIGKDFSSSFLVLFVSLNILFIAGAPIRYFLYIALTGLPLLYFLLTSVSHMKERLLKYIKKFIDTSYSPLQEKLATKGISESGLFGKGFGIGSYNNPIPEAHTDFYFATIVLDTGFIGGLTILFLYMYLYYQCFKLLKNIEELSQAYILHGAMLMLIYQTVFNLSSVLGTIPITGITLPFLSFGGNSLIVSSIFIGLILSLKRVSTKNRQQTYKK